MLCVAVTFDEVIRVFSITIYLITIRLSFSEGLVSVYSITDSINSINTITKGIPMSEVLSL